MRICRNAQFIDLSIRLSSPRKQTLDKRPLRLINHQLVAASIDLNRSVVVSHNSCPRRPDTRPEKGFRASLEGVCPLAPSFDTCAGLPIASIDGVS